MKKSAMNGATPYEISTSFMLHEFMHTLSVCHTVMVDTDIKGVKSFQASSPDELALIDGAKDAGYVFTAKNSTFIGIENIHTQPKSKEIFEVLHEFPFDSTRKRMSLVVKKRGDKTIFLLCKGADSIILPRCLLLEPIRQKIESDLNYFATQGLRTLVISKK